MKRIKLNIILLAFAQLIYSQGSNNSTGIWDLNSVNGEVLLKSFYLNKYDELRGFSDRQQGIYLQGGIKLNTKNIIWHPNFIQLDIGGEYSPEANQDKYLVAPDKSEVRTLKELNVRMAVFNNLPVSLNSFFTINENFRNRENLTNIRSNTQTWGTRLSIRNKYLPLSVNYDKYDNTIREIQTGRTFILEQSGLYVNANKSFANTDKHRFRYSYNKYFRKESDISQVANNTGKFSLYNSFYFDKEKKYSYRSLIYYYNRNGSQDYKIANITENIRFILPYQLTLSAGYNYYHLNQLAQEAATNKINTSLDHKLFNSLNSRIFFLYSDISNTYFSERRKQGGASLNYIKNIPTGKLRINYSWSLLDNRMESDPVELPVINEEYILDDTRIVLLNQPNIDPATIVVRDATGTIIYQEYLDYLLVESGSYTEIRRVPGGQIADLSSVYIDYTSYQTGSYSYDENTHDLSVNLNLLNNILEFYYHGRSMDYKNIIKSDLLVLNYLHQNTVGAKVRIKFANIGAEYENHNSTITPYTMAHIYLILQKKFAKVNLTLNGNYRDFNMVDEDINRLYTDLSAKADYRINSKMNISLSLSQRKQVGPGIDLDLYIARCEYNYVFRQVYLKAGADVYLRNYLGFDSNYINSYLQVSRRF